MVNKRSTVEENISYCIHQIFFLFYTVVHGQLKLVLPEVLLSLHKYELDWFVDRNRGRSKHRFCLCYSPYRYTVTSIKHFQNFGINPKRIQKLFRNKRYK